MLVEALVDESQHGRLIGDIPAFFIVTAVLAYLIRMVRTETIGTT